jgi:multidrug efflux pump
MAKLQRELNRAIQTDPAVESLSSFIGIDGTNTTINTGRIQINLKAVEDRDLDALAVIRRLQPKLAEIKGITLYMQPVQDLTVETRVSRTQYQYSLEDPDHEELAEWSQKFVAELQSLPELRDVATDNLNDGRKIKVDMDRDTASRLGVTPQMVDDALYNAFGQRQVSIMFTQLNQYRVILEVKPEFKNEPGDLTDIYVRTGTGGMAPLSSFVTVQQMRAPLAINHQGQFPVVTISFNLAPGVSLGNAVEAIDAAKARVGLPPSIQGEFQGTAAAFQASLKNEPILILAALVTVYIVLGVLYESYIHPITILSTLPSAGVGALMALMYCRIDLGVIGLIGIILLIGIVKKNAIMMIDFALEAEREGNMTPDEAIYQACLLRFRPIMMTTMAALLGAVPLAISTGTGAELRRPLGITIIGGLVVSQVLTLYTTPVIYLWFDYLSRPFRRKNKTPAERTVHEKEFA